MNFVAVGTFLAAFVLIGTVAMMEVGRRIGARRRSMGKNTSSDGFSVIEGSLLALLGLILAFSFSAAGSRFDARRQLIVEEANCIGTAYLRLELLQTDDKKILQESFRRYTDGRIDTYRAVPDIKKAEAGFARTLGMQKDMWTKAVDASIRARSQQAPMIVLAALNAMFDIANTRYMATRLHTPKAMFFLTGLLILACSFMMGFSMGARSAKSWIHVVTFAVMLSAVFYVIIELEYPRVGLVKISDFDQAIVDVRKTMNAPE